MIVTELYNGQGLGNQLWCYFVTKTIANINNFEFGIMSTEKFKGKEFMGLDFGNEVSGGSGPEGGPPNSLPNGITNYYREKMNFHPISRLDITEKDNDLLNIEDNTKIDGIMQCYDYIKNFRNEIISEINIFNDKNITDYTDDNICIIHIRGGDFNSSLAMLDSNYYNNAMEHLKKINPNIKFFAVTDDINTCRYILPNVTIIGSSTSGVRDSHKANHHLGGPIWMDFTILNNCKNAIISASSFSWWAIWTNKNIKNVISPKYWAAYKQSDGYWSCGDSIVENWLYLDRDNKISTSDECISELINYKKTH
jgi:hypothetical protein